MPPRRKRQQSPPPPPSPSTSASPTPSSVSDRRNDGHDEQQQVTQSNVALPASASSTTAIHPSAHFNHRVISTFTGQNEAVFIDAWLNVFELVMYEKSDSDKKNLVVRHLDGDALTWFAHHVIPIIPSLDWMAVRKLFIARFQNVTIRPLIAASDLYLKPTGTVTQYFNDKMRLLQRTTLTDLDQVALLTKGMPPKYKAHFIASTINKPSEWLLVALELESTFKKFEAKANYFQRNDPKGTHTRAPMAAQAAPAPVKKDKRDPPPCRFCKDKGIDVNHWHAVCPNNPNPKPNRNRPPVESTHVSENSEGGRY